MQSARDNHDNTALRIDSRTWTRFMSDIFLIHSFDAGAASVSFSTVLGTIITLCTVVTLKFKAFDGHDG